MRTWIVVHHKVCSETTVPVLFYREAVAGAVVEAAQGINAWSTKLQELKQGFLSEGLDTQAIDLMLSFDAVSSSLPVRMLAFALSSIHYHARMHRFEHQPGFLLGAFERSLSTRRVGLLEPH